MAKDLLAFVYLLVLYPSFQAPAMQIFASLGQLQKSNKCQIKQQRKSVNPDLD
jgi:hypothetical protein